MTDFHDLLRALLSTQRLAVLSTHRGGAPYSNLVAFSVTEDLAVLYFATTRPTRKYENLIADPRVSLLIDDRSNSPSDLYRATAATALGTASELGGLQREEGSRIYLTAHPELSSFTASPSCALFEVRVSTYIIVTRFQEVREIRPPL